VTAVVAHHVGLPGASAGFVGVDVFFVISGYLITLKLAEARGLPVGAALADFYARRARRILPTLAVVVATTLALGRVFLLPTGEQQELCKSGLMTALFASNMFFWRRGHDYFADPSALQPLLHTWSLAVEEQFYLVWPLLLFALWAAQRRWGSSGRDWFAVATIALLTFASFALSLRLAMTSPDAAFFTTPPRMWELGIGALLALTLKAGDRPRLGAALGLLGLSLMLLPAVFYRASTMAYEFALLSAVLGTALTLAGGALNGPGLVYRVLIARPVTFTGEVSYAWYLWHWPLIAIARVLDMGDRDLLRDSGLALLAYALACLSTRYLERPIRNQQIRYFTTARRAIVCGIASALVLATVSAALWREAAAEFRRSLAPQSLSCLQERHPSVPIEDSPCTLAQGQNGSVFLIGDSHANHWSPAIASWAAGAQVSAFERSLSSCPVPFAAFAPNGIFEGSFVQLTSDCRAFSEAVLKEVLLAAKGPTPVGVILSSHWEIHTPSEAHALPGGIEEAQAIVIDSLEAAGVRVLLIGSTPEFKYDPPACLARRNDESCLLARARHDTTTAATNGMLQRTVASRTGARVWDPTSALCDASYCRPVIDDRLMFRDYGHLSRAGAEASTPLLAPHLDWLSSP